MSNYEQKHSFKSLYVNKLYYCFYIMWNENYKLQTTQSHKTTQYDAKFLQENFSL